MAERPSLNLSDPLLPHFVYQHDLRARLFHYIEEMLVILESGDDPEDVVVAVRSMARDAISPKSISDWIRSGRPLPYVEVENKELAEALNKALAELLDQEAEGDLRDD